MEIYPLFSLDIILAAIMFSTMNKLLMHQVSTFSFMDKEQNQGKLLVIASGSAQCKVLAVLLNDFAFLMQDRPVLFNSHNEQKPIALNTTVHVDDIYLDLF